MQRSTPWGKSISPRTALPLIESEAVGPARNTDLGQRKLGPELGPRLHRTQPNSLEQIRSNKPDSTY